MKKRMKYIWLFAKPYKWSFVNAFLCILLTSIISMIYPSVFGLLVDEVFYNKNLKFFIVIIVGYVIIYFTEQILHLILNILWPYQFNVYLLDIRKEIYKKILSLKYEKLSNMSVGDMIGKINWQADAFVELLHRNIAYLFSNTIKLITIFLFVLFMNYRLAILLIIVVPVSYITSFKLGKRVGEKQAKVRDSYMGFLGWVFEMLGGIRDIKLFHAELPVLNKCDKLLMDINKKNEEMAKAEVITERVCALIAIITNISLYTIAGVLVYKNQITLGAFIAVIAYFEMTNTLLASINMFWARIHGNGAIIDQLVELLESEDENQEEGEDIEITEGTIEFKNVDFSYDDKNILNQMSLKIEAGQSVAIVGKSGAGKSTIANLLLKMLGAQNGEILIDSHNINKMSVRSVREQIGIVQQEIFIFDGTIRENLRLANPKASDVEMLDALKNAGLENYIKKSGKGLDTLLGQKGISMSGGEQQRLAIARMFLKNAKILVFDEATSSLDTESENYVNEAWKKLAENRTAIVIAHRLSTIISTDYVTVLEDGKIVGFGKHDELLENNTQYRSLFQKQYLNRQKVIENGW